jgi:hypothetical protein
MPDAYEHDALTSQGAGSSGFTAEETPKQGEDPSGVGGWLALLIFGFTILGPLMAIGEIDRYVEEAEIALPRLTAQAMWLRYTAIVWKILYSMAFLSFMTGCILLFSRTWRAVILAIATLWLVGPVSNLAYQVAAVVSVGSFSAVPAPALAGALLRSTAVATLWTAYLLRSKRVKNTYQVTSDAAAGIS